ncbi:MAG: carbonic anhydrase [Armatimonadetes bacterium]|nr:carbonic anhydrase [Armatimonadota bacterium]MBS1711307.1 carbonic anhydrase [Armatimonadota bacterium]MBX3107768.1 carbonic anhydrase [Fimbriimonadaceae bacterium]
MIACLTTALQLVLLNNQISTRTSVQVDNATVAKKLNPYAENAFKRLVEGNARFAEGLNEHVRQNPEARKVAASGQAPHTIVVTCADSRVSPEILFDQGLGDLFVIRVAGNVVDQFGIASIEYAAEHLNSPLLVVLGHERCGAVKAAVETYQAKLESHNESTGDHGSDLANINALIEEILPSVMEAARKPGDLLANAVDINVENSINQAMGRSAILRKRAEESKFDVIGATYDLDTGRVAFTAPKDIRSFVRLVDKK